MDDINKVKLYDIDLTERQSIIREDIFVDKQEESFYIKFLKCIICYDEDVDN